MKKTINKKQYNIWKNIFLSFPISINNYYGDPLIQWDDTVKKLHKLLHNGHKGPVGIITKGVITNAKAQILSDLTIKGLNIVVLISISELPQFEKIGMDHRYKNISILNHYNIKNIAYIRPMIPPYNTSAKIINKICKKLHECGAKTVVVSGFRGDNNIIKDMNPNEVVEWTLRVKLMTGDVYKRFKYNLNKYHIKMFTRTSCAVSYLLNQSKSYNPYYFSPNLVKCYDLKCPILNTCKSLSKPRFGSLSLLEFLGYKVQFAPSNNINFCATSPEKRLNCPSCCTTCYMLKNPRIIVKNKVSLGDLTFIRFVTQMLSIQPGVNDNGDLDIAKVTLPNFKSIKNIQCLNSWMPYAHIGETCFDCKYCIEKYYSSNRKNIGMTPIELFEKIIKLSKTKIV